MNDMTILCYLDVLGYSKLVLRHHTNDALIKNIETIFQTSVGHLKDMKEQGIFDDPRFEEYHQRVINALKIRFMSDSLIYTLDLSKTADTSTHSVEMQPLYYCVHAFFRLISMFCTTLTGKTGLVVRGAMTIGPHYERDWDEDGSRCLFVFSKAFVNAVDLEKKEAKTARIIFDGNLIRYLKDKTNLDIDEFVFTDGGGKSCFDLYNIFHPLSADNARKALREIKKGVTMNMADSYSDPNALEKLHYFAEYHNKWVRKFCADTDLLIDCREMIG